MTRLTIHLADPIFFDAVQTNVGTKENAIMRPKKKKCIKTTLSFRNVSQTDASQLIVDIRKTHGIARWSNNNEMNWKKGQEMIYIVN
tara:strand:+ start:217 stop:477 length:261 start_codon:yes stop_codon:yes gene_type:complete